MVRIFLICENSENQIIENADTMAETDFKAEIDLMKKIGYHERLGENLIMIHFYFFRHSQFSKFDNSSESASMCYSKRAGPSNNRILFKRRLVRVHARTVHNISRCLT